MQVRIAHNGIVVEVGEGQAEDDGRFIVRVTEKGGMPDGSARTDRVSLPMTCVVALARALDDVLELAVESPDGVEE